MSKRYTRAMRPERSRVALAAAVVLVAACSFDPQGLAGDDVAPVPDAARIVDAVVADAAPPPCPSDDELVACYRFEGDGTDDTVAGNHAVATDVVYLSGRPDRGTAILFSPNASVVAPDSASLDVTTGLTVEAWLLMASLPQPNGRMAVLDNNGQYGVFVAPDGAVRCSVGTTTAIGLTVRAGTWTHLACTYDGTIIRMYQDGVAGPTIAFTGAVPTFGTDGLGLGQNLPVPPADHLDGMIDDVRIWRVALPATAICASAGTCR